MSRLEVPTRIPPHNLDAERAVLGAILLEGRETLPRVIELLKPSDFYTEAHRVTYQGMLTLFNRSEPVDVLTLTEEPRRGDQLQLVGGPAALALLVEQGSISAYLSSYTSIVRDRAVLRELIQTSSQIIAQAFEAKDDVQTLVDDAERRIFSLAERRLEGSALPIGKILRNTFEYIERLYEAPIFIDDSPNLTVLEARAKARRMKAEHGLDLVIIDYLQLMRGRAHMDNRQQEISEISRSLKALAKELTVPVVALSQLSRAVETRAQRDFRPQLSDLRECVTGDTLVLLADGRRVAIQDLVH